MSYNKFKGDLKKIYSVTIRANWRIVFQFEHKHAILVNYIDYHWRDSNMPIHAPLHPGEIIRHILIEGAALSVTEASAQLGVNRTTLSRLLHGHSGISAEMALRLSKLLPNTDMVFWMNLQRDYDIWTAMKKASSVRVKPLKAA